MMTIVSSHKCDKCGVVYHTMYIGEYNPVCNWMIVSVFILHLWALQFIILFSSLCTPFLFLIRLFIHLLKSWLKWHKPTDLY